MKIKDAQATFIAEALGDLPDKTRAAGLIAPFIQCSSAVVREGALLGLGRIRELAEARDLIRVVMESDPDKDLRRMATRILTGFHSPLSCTRYARREAIRKRT
jgi:HEAT repeat protein